MRKNGLKTACISILATLVSASAMISFTQKPNVGKADGLQTERSAVLDETTSLLSPDSYEEYLSLQSPADVAVTDDYIAVADGNLIYLYDKTNETYRKYAHSVNTESALNSVTKMQFGEDNRLYFRDASSFLYYVNADGLTEENEPQPINTGVPCYTFSLYGEYIYFSNAQSPLSRTSINEPKVSTAEILVPSLHSTPQIAFWNGELYYTNGGTYLHKLNPEDPKNSSTPVAIFKNEVFSMQIVDGVFACSVKDADGTDGNKVKYNYYAYGLNELSSSERPESATLVEYVTPLAFYDGYYGALCAFDKFVYAVEGSSIRQYSIQTSAFTDYEISNVSDSLHRINNGEETLLCGDVLYIADNGNRRISVYDVKRKHFGTPIATEIAPRYLAGDENTLLAANATQAVLYDLTPERYGETLAVFNNFHDGVVGATNVYGKYYFATESNYYYMAQTTETGWQLTETKKTSTNYAKLLTSDAYGHLYVASNNSLARVYRFTESEFLDGVGSGTELENVRLPAQTKKFLVDYDGNVYALADGKIQKANESEPYALNTPLVYSETATIASFAFGIEENETYVLYEENYAARTTLLNLPTVKNIPVNGLDAEIFDDSAATVEIVKISLSAMLIDFNLSALNEADVFPYLNYSRQTAPQRALKIAATKNGKHNVLVFYDKVKRDYRACLALVNDCTPLSDEEKKAVCKSYDVAQTGYLSNDIPVYKFPHLSGLPTVIELPRNTKISVLGEVNELDHSYYYVEYKDDTGVTHKGYIPQPYVIDFDPTPPQPETEIYGAKESDKDSAWQLAFLLLGGAAILLLTDVLIFRLIRKK